MASAIVVLLACSEGRRAEPVAKAPEVRAEMTAPAQAAAAKSEESPVATVPVPPEWGVRPRENPQAAQQLGRARAREISRCFEVEATCPIWFYQETYEIEVDGRVQDVTLEIKWHRDELEERKPRVTKCLTEAISSYRYNPPPSTRARVTYPVHVDWFDDGCWVRR